MLAPTLIMAFGLELAALFAFGLWGVHLGQNALTQAFLGIGIPLLIAIFWGTFLSPRTVVKLSPLLQLVLKLTVFVLATAALVATGHLVSGMVFGILAVAVTLGLYTSRIFAEELHSFQHP